MMRKIQNFFVMWCASVNVLILATFASATTRARYVYPYAQVSAVTPQPQNASSSALPTPNPYEGLDPDIIKEVFGAPSAFTAAKEVSQEVFKPLYEDYDEFDWKLTKQVASTTEENFLLSPFGLKLALAILTEGATGITAAEIRFALGFDPNATKLHDKFDRILGSLLAKSDQYILDLGSRIYLANRTDPQQKFAAVAAEHYKTEVRKADFDHPAAAVTDINGWISNVTHGRISKLVSEGDLANAVMVVLNTLFLKGTWKQQFEPNDTRYENFYVGPKKIVAVPFMTMQHNFYYGESVRMQAKILRMPYLGNKLSMYLVVPNSIMGLSRVMQEMTSQQLKQEVAFMTPCKVRVTLPRFQFEYTSQLDEVLKKLGVVHAFEPTASFPGISRGEGTDMIQISKIVQKSGVDVNEMGSVVYTATEVALVNRFGDEDDSIIEVKANKPFFFFIEDETTRQLLFTGRISDPSAAKEKTI